MVRQMVDAGVPTLANSTVLKALLDNPEQAPPAYPAHEYLVNTWQPLWVGEVRAAMAGIGLRPVGSATLVENYDAFVLGEKARDLLAQLPEDVREMVRDFYISQRFRRDVFFREGELVDEDEQRRPLLGSTFALAAPPAEVEYSMATPAGKVGFDADDPLTKPFAPSQLRSRLRTWMLRQQVACALSVRGFARPPRSASPGRTAC